MPKKIKLTETDLIKIISKLINEQTRPADSSPQDDFMNGPVKEFCKKTASMESDGIVTHSAKSECEYNSPCHQIIKAIQKMQQHNCDPTIK